MRSEPSQDRRESQADLRPTSASFKSSSIYTRRSYLVALLMTATLVVSSYLLLNRLTAAQKDSALVISMSGRQLTLSQRIALLADSMLDPHGAAEYVAILKELQARTDEMLAVHEQLITGKLRDDIVFQVPSTIYAIYFDPPIQLDRRVRDYLAAARALASTDEAITAANRDMRYILDTNRGLLTALDAMVRQYDIDDKVNIDSLQKIQTGVLVALLVLLVVEGWFIFRPMERRIREREQGWLREIQEREHAEMATWRSESMYRTLAVNLPDIGVSLFDRDLRYTIVEGAFLERLGYNKQAMEGHTAEEVLPPDRYQEFLPYYQSALNGQATTFEGSISRDKLYYWRTQIVPLRDNDGTIIGGMVLSQDITEQKQSEADMRESEELFRQLFENSMDGVMLTETSGKILMANPAACRLLGRTEAEIIRVGRNGLVDLTDPRLITALQERERTGSSHAVFRMVRGDGTLFTAETTSKVYKTQGNTSKTSMIIRDVTERVAAETALRASEERFRQLAENILQVFWILSPDGSQILYISPAYEILYERTCASMYENPNSFLETVHPEDRDAVEMNRIEKILHGDYNIEYRIVCSDGHIRWIWSRAVPIYDDTGAVTKIIGIAEDISERKLVEQQQRELIVEKDKVQMLADFIRDTSHDLRTPLTTIHTGLYLLKRTADPIKQRERIEIIEEQADQLNNMIEQMHMMSRLDVGLEFHLRVLDISRMVDAVTTQFEKRAAQKRLQLKTTFQPDLMAKIDEIQMTSALMGIFENALYYTPEGGMVSVQTYRLNGDAAVEIRDNGIGISAEDLPHIFERFYKADKSRTQNTSGGAGLGLTIAKKIVEGHQGRIEVESTPGQGSLFRIMLPVSGGDAQT